MTTAPGTGGSDLHALRRADWRFLLTDPEVARVALVGGSVAAQHRGGLEADGVDVVELAAGERVPDGTDAIVSSADPDLVASLLSDQPDTPVHVELGPRAPLDRRWWSLLRQQSSTQFLVVPDHDRRRAYAPLADGRSMRWLGAGRPGLVGRLARSGLGDLRAARAVASRLAPARAVILSQAPRQHALGAWVAAAGLIEPSDGAPVSHLLVTPRFATSRHVVLLAGLLEPEVVVKTSRLAGSGVDREADALRQLWIATEGRDVGAPRLLRQEVWGRRTVFAETVVKGAAVTSRSAAADPAGTAADLTTWLLGLPRSGSSATPRRLAALLTPALESASAMGGEQVEHLVRATRLATAELAQRELPVVFEHGDVSAPNIVRTGQGIALIDWELAQPVGLPAHDLFVALGFVARACSNHEPHRALEESFLRLPPPWVRDEVARYANAVGLPAEALPPLFICCWARVAASLSSRADTSGGDIGWWRSQAATRLWHAAVEQPHLLDWMRHIQP